MRRGGWGRSRKRWRLKVGVAERLAERLAERRVGVAEVGLYMI